MKPLWKTLILGSFGVALATLYRFYDLPPEHSINQSVDCPQNWLEWNDWRYVAIKHLAEQRYSTGVNAIYAKIDGCKAQFENLGEKARCFDNLRNFSYQSFKTHIRGYSLGLAMTDHEYFQILKEEGLGSLPEPFLNPKLLLEIDAAAPGQLAELAVALEKLGPSGTIAFPYTSKHIASVDDAEVYGRLFVYIPDDRKDIYAQYAVGIGKRSQLPNSISVITVQKTDKTGALFPRPKVYYNDLWRVRGESISVQDRIVNNRRMENCYLCHKSPLISIYPADDFDYHRFGNKLTWINQRMSEFSGAEYVGISIQDYGPGLGIASPNLAACHLSQDLMDKVDGSLDCKDCHNGNDRGTLNFPSGLESQLPNATSLAQLFVESYGIMPPLLFELKAEQRQAIYQCIIRDLYGDFNNPKTGRLNQWLFQDDCN